MWVSSLILQWQLALVSYRKVIVPSHFQVLRLSSLKRMPCSLAVNIKVHEGIKLESALLESALLVSDLLLLAGFVLIFGLWRVRQRKHRRARKGSARSLISLWQV